MGQVAQTRAAVLAGAPDPADAARQLDRLADAVALVDLPHEAIEILRVACQRAPYLTTLLTRDARRLARVAADPYLHREKPAAVMAAELAELPAGDEAELCASLRRWRHDEMVRLGVRELADAEAAAVGRELADLAGVAFDAALAFWDARLRARHGPPRYTDDDGVDRDCELTVIGMGKLGGRELNFSSDVDVIYVYSSDAGAAGERSLHEYYAELCRKVTAAISELTADEFVFRVDLRLRPEGSRGAIANSLPSTERYYEAWGRPWERQAWLKARPCAGSRALGDEVMRTLEPFIHPRHTSPAVIAEVAELNRKIKAELDSSGVDSGFDVKNGIGGIREVEFFVQALQLVHAGHRRELRARGTLAALDQLLFTGLITDAEHRELADAYRVLRRLEHGLQLETGRQTQRLPGDARRLELYARRMGYADAAALRDHLRALTGPVAALFASLGSDDEGPPPDIHVLLDFDAPPERAREALARLGFDDVDQALHQLEYGRRKPLSPIGPSAEGAAARVAPDLLWAIATSPDPDQALGFLVELISRRGSWSALWRLFADNRAAMQLVASVMGSSAYLSRQFVNHPELIDGLLQSGRATARLAHDDIDASVGRRLAQAPEGDEEAAWSALAAAKQAHVLRVGLGDIAGDLKTLDVSQQLTAIADVCLRRAYAMVSDSVAARYGAGGALAVLGLGKLGGGELGYASDLDLVFVHDDGADVELASRIARRLMSALHAMHPGGRLYETDARLRPDGTRGMLVVSVSGWERYHRDSAQLWERQALIKLRAVAGDAALGARVEELARAFVYAPPHDRAALASTIRGMRDRIERELGGGPDAMDLKAGRGGLIDAEFAAQYLQLAYGAEHAELRTRATVPALRAAAALVVADPDACAVLADGYEFLRALEQRIRIVHDRSENRLPRQPRELAKLARRAGFASSDALHAAYLRWTDQIRAAYDRVVESPSGR